MGTVRSVANEILVGKDRAVIHLHAAGARRHALQHVSWHARGAPVTATTSKLVYTLFFDNSNLPDEAAKQADKGSEADAFMRALQNMKTLAEGGTLPPPPARGRP